MYAYIASEFATLHFHLEGVHFNRKAKMDGAKSLSQVNGHVEDYDPTMEWVPDAGFDTLLLYIPGFKKQQLKVQVTSVPKLRITGERLRGDNKWSCFHKELPIPSYYDANQISAKFEGGILYVKHPKKIISPANPEPEKNANSTAETAEPQKPTNEKSQDQKSRQDQIVRGVLSKAKLDEQTSTGRKINEIAYPTVTETKIKDPQKSLEDEKSDHGLVEAEKVTRTSEKHENDSHLVHNAKKMNKEASAFASGSGKTELLANQKQVLGVSVPEMKDPRKSANFVLAAGVLALLIGLYVGSAMRSHQESKN